jgi:phosphoglycolate phosphatase
MTGSSTNPITAAVFDVDGTLLDTREFIFTAYEATLKKLGYEIPDRLTIAKQIGRSLHDCYVAFAPQGDIDALCEAHHIFQNTPEMIGLITPYPGALAMLQTLKDSGIKLAVFSSRKLTLVASLEQANIASFFEVIIQGDEVANHKPHPEGLFKALGGLEVLPNQAVMIGDAAVDILAGKAANVALTIGITHGFGTPEELAEAHPDHTVTELSRIAPLLLGE